VSRSTALCVPNAAIRTMDNSPLPPPPVLITRADLPRVTALVVAGYAAVGWLALQVDAYFAPDDGDDAFYYP
jgi:hypothetical protein